MHSCYRLSEYKIMQYAEGDLKWETHFGLGACKGGKCFQKGSILFIGPAEKYSSGFLKSEFMDNLRNYPEWMSTKYYCISFGIMLCKNSRRISRKDMHVWAFEKTSAAGNRAFGLIERSQNASFRLDRYEIKLLADGKIVWKSFAGPHTLRSGPCIMLEDILFIEPPLQDSESLSKKDFMNSMQNLPLWAGTKYYCPRFSLHECKCPKMVPIAERELFEARTDYKFNMGKKRDKDESKIGWPYNRFAQNIKKKPVVFRSLAECWLLQKLQNYRSLFTGSTIKKCLSFTLVFLRTLLAVVLFVIQIIERMADKIICWIKKR